MKFLFNNVNLTNVSLTTFQVYCYVVFQHIFYKADAVGGVETVGTLFLVILPARDVS